MANSNKVSKIINLTDYKTDEVKPTVVLYGNIISVDTKITARKRSGALRRRVLIQLNMPGKHRVTADLKAELDYILPRDEQGNITISIDNPLEVLVVPNRYHGKGYDKPIYFYNVLGLDR